MFHFVFFVIFLSAIIVVILKCFHLFYASVRVSSKTLNFVKPVAFSSMRDSRTATDELTTQKTYIFLFASIFCTMYAVCIIVSTPTGYLLLTKNIYNICVCEWISITLKFACNKNFLARGELNCLLARVTSENFLHYMYYMPNAK